jgi:hypothetical protein
MSDNDENSVEEEIAALKKKNEALLEENHRYRRKLIVWDT